MPVFLPLRLPLVTLRDHLQISRMEGRNEARTTNPSRHLPPPASPLPFPSARSSKSGEAAQVCSASRAPTFLKLLQKSLESQPPLGPAAVARRGRFWLSSTWGNHEIKESGKVGGGEPKASARSGVGCALPAARRGPGWALQGSGAQAGVLRTNRRPGKPLPFGSCREKAGRAAGWDPAGTSPPPHGD